ncbi:MAG: RDD family protein [Chloroflexota bacterium]
MTNTGDFLRIDTPENVTFDYDVAGIGSRFLAALVDTIMLVLLQVIVIGTLILLEIQFSIFEGIASGWVTAVFSFIAFAFFWGYYIFFEIIWNGQTPGKRWVKLRVIRVDGTPVTAAEVIIRNLVRMIDLLPAGYAVGVTTMFLNDKSRRLGDLAAGTIVVHERPAAALETRTHSELAALATVSPREGVPAGFPLERLTDRDFQMLEDFMLRRYHLPNRASLARHILVSLYKRLGLPTEAVPQGETDDALAALYVAARSRRQE